MRYQILDYLADQMKLVTLLENKNRFSACDVNSLSMPCPAGTARAEDPLGGGF
ncbi:hypothetical protein GCM10011351_31490 [Paraliobacillus quinghaiensis]|uniref:Uncharacterized protein n=1 Tax=Paraliobacillus quinghaiensis TaxID=470815 RepID=A0A917WZK2_9BACI|nr:hypothetical protein [Paraliobacillus quinghaiensis]GGM43242.1 hypothetical protein GCM10011351_31490 [Paraliobacillus quinghaiensis]